jgi:hypothetical protein
MLLPKRPGTNPSALISWVSHSRVPSFGNRNSGRITPTTVRFWPATK